VRRLSAALALSVAATTFSTLPVTTFSAAASPRPVEPSIERISLADAAPADPDRPAPPTADGSDQEHEPLALTPVRETDEFAMVGVTWRGSGKEADPDVWVRTRSDDQWSNWQELEYDEEHGPDPGTFEARRMRDGTAPFWVGDSDGVQVRVDTVDGEDLPGLRAELVDPGESPADGAEPAAPPASASAAVSKPTIFTREQWGADESLRDGFAGYGSTIRLGFVHHTVNGNDYTRDDVARLIRGIYAYHTKSNGWSDIGYNFLVDKFGRLWEGRWGGMSKPVIGAHTYPYNENTFAVSAIGNFETATAPNAMTSSIGRLMAWKLGMYGRNVKGSTTLAGTTFKNIAGHSDAKATACPGRYLYEKLPRIRRVAANVTEAAGDSGSGGEPSLTSTENRGRYDLAAMRLGRTRGVLANSNAELATELRTWRGGDGVGPATNLGGRTAYRPSVIKDRHGRTVVVRTALNSRVYYKRKSLSGTWTGWRRIGGIVTSAPSAVLYRDKVHVFARARDGSAAHITRRGGKWIWQKHGGTMPADASPAVVATADRTLSLVIAGTGGRVRLRTFVPGSGWASSWRSLGGNVVRSPAVAAVGRSTIAVAVRTPNGISVRDVTGTSVGPWQDIGGNVWGAPAAMGASGRLDVFVYGTDGQIARKTRTDRWSGWTSR
jgi:hypothetical protein